MEISAQVPAGISAVLADARDRVVGEALAALNERDQAGCLASSPAERRQDMEHLFELIQRCLNEGHCEPIIGPSQRMAADHFANGIEIAEVQAAFTVLENVLWRQLADALSGDDQRLETLRLINVILGAGRDALARTYVSLASHAGPLQGQPLPGLVPPPGGAETGGTSETGTGGNGGDGGSGAGARHTEDGRGAAGAGVVSDEHSVIRTAIHGQVGVITLNDRHKRNAIGARMANSIVAALGSMRARKVRTVVIRAAPEMSVWSAGHDIDELPRAGATRWGTTIPWKACSARSARSRRR